MKATYQPKRAKDGIFIDQILTGGHMLAGGKLQEIHEQSAVQNYDIGTRLVLDDRTFRYCKAASDLKALIGARNANFPREGNTKADVEYAAGTYQITIPMNDNGDDYVAEQLKDYWKEGYVWIMWGPTDVRGYGHLYRIKGNAVAAGTIPTQYVLATLYDALHTKVTSETWITAWANIYSNIVRSVSKRMSVVCIPPIPVTSGYYFWGQTWGPCFISCTHAAPGSTDNDRDLFIHESNQGEIISGSQCDWSGASSIKHQRVGFLLTNTTPWTNVGDGAESGGDQFMMLQLAP